MQSPTNRLHHADASAVAPLTCKSPANADEFWGPERPCDKGTPGPVPPGIWEAKELPVDQDGIAAMNAVVRQQDNAADNNPAQFGLPSEQDPEDGLVRVNGQTAGQLTTGKDVTLFGVLADQDSRPQPSRLSS